MISKYDRYRSICKTSITEVENYDKAIADETQEWVLHHRLETHKYKDRTRTEWIRRDENLSRKVLVAFGVYFLRPAEELIFMTRSDHHKLHMDRVSEEHRANMNKGHIGCKLSEDHKKKLSEAKLNNPVRYWSGKKLSEEHKKKLAESKKGRGWYNNGERSTLSRECPEGFVPGRLPWRKK